MFYENKNDFFFLVCEKNPLEYPLHIHQYIELVHLVQGKIEMQIGSRHYTLFPGDFAIIFPNVTHDYHTILSEKDPNVQIHILNCYIDFLPFHKNQMLNAVPVDSLLHAEQIHEDVLYAEKRLFEVDQDNYDYTLVSSLVSLMLCRMIPLLSLSDRQTQSSTDISCDIISYIADHYCEDISLTSVANHFGIGKYNLSRIFSNTLKISFISYVNSLRLNYAEYLLGCSDLNIIDIAIECGFHNQQTFNRVFKGHNNCTPKEFREQKFLIKLASGYSHINGKESRTIKLQN